MFEIQSASSRKIMIWLISLVFKSECIGVGQKPEGAQLISTSSNLVFNNAASLRAVAR